MNLNDRDWKFVITLAEFMLGTTVFSVLSPQMVTGLEQSYLLLLLPSMLRFLHTHTPPAHTQKICHLPSILLKEHLCSTHSKESAGYLKDNGNELFCHPSGIFFCVCLAVSNPSFQQREGFLSHELQLLNHCCGFLVLYSRIHVNFPL